MMVPESFTPKRRFTADSKRSPACAATESGTASASPVRTPMPPIPAVAPPATSAATRPLSAPDHVFFGETRGQSLGPPMPRPPK